MSDHKLQPQTQDAPLDFEALVHTLESGVILLDAELKVLFWNDWLATYTKVASSEAVGLPLDQLFPQVNRASLQRRLKAVLELDSPMFFDNLANNSFIPIRLRRMISPLYETMQQRVTMLPYDPKKRHVAIVIHDQTTVKETEDQLQTKITESQLQHNRNLDLIDAQVSMVTFDLRGSVRFCTHRLAKQLNITKEELSSQTLKVFFERFALDCPDSPEDIWNTIRKGRDWHGEFSIPGWTKQAVWLKGSIKTDTSAQEIIALFEDISDQKLIQLIATQDPLTKISNRKAFSERLNHELGVAERYGSNFTLGMIDLDKFKTLNDQHGHQSGDMVLIETSRVIKELIRDSDTFARWAGQEFILLFPQIDLVSTKITLNKVREALASHHFPEVGNLTASFGATAFRKGDSHNDIVERAEQALYRSKHAGRNRVTIF